MSPHPIEAMKQALDALEYIHTETTEDEDELIHAAITALRTAIEQAEKQEPVAWRYRGNLHEFDPSDWAEGPVTPLYTTPPAAQRLPLTTMQPIVDVNGVKRFKANAIVRHLIDTHPSCDMNVLSRMDFSDEDRMQFAQLIGYSLSGYSELSYVSDESYDAAEKAAHGITEEKNT